MPAHLFSERRRNCCSHNLCSRVFQGNLLAASHLLWTSLCASGLARMSTNSFETLFFLGTQWENKLPQLVFALPVLPFLGILKISLMIWTTIACWSDFLRISIYTHHRPLYCFVGVTGPEPIPAAFRQEVQPPQPAPSLSDQMLLYNNVIGF